MTQEQTYNTLLGLANNLQDTIYSDTTHQTIIFDIGQTCYLNAESNYSQTDVLASQTLEKLKIIADELASLVANLTQLPSAQQSLELTLSAPDIQSARNEIFVTADNGIHTLISLLTSVQELDAGFDHARVEPKTISQIRKIYQAFNNIKEYLRKN
jgi:hypothetical protein